MILVASSVWIDHLRIGDAALAERLELGIVLGHPFVLGELACGRLRNRTEILMLLADLPQSVPAADAEVLAMIERHRLMGRGIGWVDAHLLTSTLLTSGAALWTRDRRLAAITRDLGVDGRSGH